MQNPFFFKTPTAGADKRQNLSRHYTPFLDFQPARAQRAAAARDLE